MASGVAGGAVLHRWTPGAGSFYPFCPFHQVTGLLCPGCGGTRALAALTHGHVVEAWHLNALLVIMLPVSVGYGLRAYFALRREQQVQQPRLRTIVVMLGLAMGFAVMRNFS